MVNTANVIPAKHHNFIIVFWSMFTCCCYYLAQLSCTVSVCHTESYSCLTFNSLLLFCAVWTVLPQRRPRGTVWRAWAPTAAPLDKALCWRWTSRTSRRCGMKRFIKIERGGKHRRVKVQYICTIKNIIPQNEVVWRLENINALVKLIWPKTMRATRMGKNWLMKLQCS